MSLLARQRLPISGASDAGPVFDAPIDITDALITSNGSNVFEGNWENTSYSTNNGAAIYVTTSQPVIIQNSRFKAQRYCVNSLTNGSNITVRNCVGLVRNTTQAGQPAHRFLNLGQPGTVVCENNTMIGGGIYLNQAPSVGSTSATIRYNRAINIDGRISDGAGGYVFERSNTANVYFQAKQFLQINIGTFSDAEIAWNEIVNEPFISRPEDSFNITDAAGDALSPISIHDNFVDGGSCTRPFDATFSGGGIVTEGSTIYLNIDDNQIVGYNNLGIGLAGGDHINVRRNRLVSAGSVSGRVMISRNRAGVNLGASSTYCVIADNGYSWLDFGGSQAGWYITNSANTGNTHTGDYSLGASTTAATEQVERDYWAAKVLAAGVTIGSTLAHW